MATNHVRMRNRSVTVTKIGLSCTIFWRQSKETFFTFISLSGSGRLLWRTSEEVSPFHNGFWPGSRRWHRWHDNQNNATEGQVAPPAHCTHLLQPDRAARLQGQREAPTETHDCRLQCWGIRFGVTLCSDIEPPIELWLKQCNLDIAWCDKLIFFGDKHYYLLLKGIARRP